MKNFLLLKILIFYLIIITNVLSKQIDFFDQGLKLFEKNKFEKSKILFEKDIVFNPKSEKSYLYLAKIFNNSENDEEEEINLKN